MLKLICKKCGKKFELCITCSIYELTKPILCGCCYVKEYKELKNVHKNK